MPRRSVAKAVARKTSEVVPGSKPESASSPSLVMRLQRSLGNREVGGWIQAKLRVGAPNDRYEMEADHIADLVMSFPHEPRDAPITATHGPILQPCSCGGTCPKCASHEDGPSSLVQRFAVSASAPESIQRESTETCSPKDEAATPEEAQEHQQEEEQEQELAPPGEEKDKPPEVPVQPKRYSPVTTLPDDVEDRLNATRSEGEPLPLPTRRLMENRFGYDFSHVRVHMGGSAQRLNHDLNALAFTTGNHIYFAPGQFQPGTRTGQHLLAHELTHVVQQAGGAALGGHGIVREKADPGTISRMGDFEKKPYYKHWVSGELVHYRIERLLREEDKELVTEAAIPGADRWGARPNKIGVADLYKSKPARTVSGVKGYREVEKAGDIVAMNDPSFVGTQPAVTSSPTVSGKLSAPARTFAGDFPASVDLGEIKPLGTSKVAEGLFQLDSYDQGYKAFVAKIHTISGTTRASMGVGRLNFQLPAFLDFDNWAVQHTIPDRRTTIGDRRLWAANIGSGIYVYFDLAKGLAGSAPKFQSEQLAKMREIRSKLGGGKHPRTEKMDPMVSGRFLPGGPKIVGTRDAPGSAPGLIQRSTKDRPDNYWKERSKEWEEERSKWGKSYRSTLKTDYRQYREKLEAEKKLSRSSRSAPAGEKVEARDYKQLLFWSGLPGRFLGKIRFLLGSAWDKIIAIFEKMKEKLHGLRQKVSGTSEEGLSLGGWRKTLIKILVKAAKFVFIKFITESFNFFVECFHSAMDKVWAKLQAELTKKFAEELCKARKFFDESKDRLEKEWGVSFQQLGDLLKTIQDVKNWVDIATGLIQLIRLGVQVVSCLTPPALGCLWGLVAQIGIGTALDLLIGTQWFNDNIIKPTIGDLVRKYAGPYYQKLINRALGDDLKEYHCHIADQQELAFGSAFSDGLQPGSSELMAHRDSWEAKNKDAMVKDLQSAFQGRKGKRVTQDELQQLADYLKKSNMSAESLKQLLESARDPLTGRLKFEAAEETIKTGELPPTPPGGGSEGKQRKIDYPKATKRNKELQRSLGWDPFTFYRKPGISADSEEFADAIYDTQEALHIPADGILGEQTLIAFYDRNKLKHDAAYESAAKVRDEKKAAREKKAAKERVQIEKTTEVQEESGDLVAISVPRPPAGTTIIGPDLPSDPVWTSIPFGTVEPEIKEGETHAAGETITLNVRFWLEHQWVWFPSIPATFRRLDSFRGRRMVDSTTTEDFYFKLTPGAAVVYWFNKGNHGMFVE